MADDFEEDGQQPIAPNTVPALAQLSGALTDPAAKDAISEAAARLNDHVQQRTIADANQQAGANFDADMSAFSGGLSSFVQNDPTGVHAALDAVPPVVNAVARSIPGHPEDKIDGHVDEMTRDMQRTIASAAVHSAAMHHEDLAHGMLDNERIAGLFSDDEMSNLRQYTDMQATARRVDGDAQAAVAAQAADTRAGHSMFGYAQALYNPASGSTVFPPGWNQAVLADNSVTPGDTAALRQMYGRLRYDGGADASDPFVAHSLVDSIAADSGPHPRDILSHVAAGNLRMQDALHLASLSSDPGRAADDHAAGLSQLMRQARTAIMGIDGENGVAGARAFGRYVNWVLPAYQRTGSAGANPNDPSYLHQIGIASFLPTASDFVTGLASGVARSLDSIFARPDVGGLDEVIGDKGGTYHSGTATTKEGYTGGAGPNMGAASRGVIEGARDYGVRRTQSGDTVENPPREAPNPIPLRQWPMYQTNVRRDDT